MRKQSKILQRLVFVLGFVPVHVKQMLCIWCKISTMKDLPSVPWALALLEFAWRILWSLLASARPSARLWFNTQWFDGRSQKWHETRGVSRQAPCGPHRLCGPSSKKSFFRTYPSLRSCIDKLHCSVIRGSHVFCLGCSCKTKNSPLRIGLLQKERIVSHTPIFRDRLLLIGCFNPFEKYSSNWESSPRIGVKIENIWVATT